MPETKTFECPNCGSPLTTTGEENEVKCPSCGSTVIVPQQLRDAPQHQPEMRAYSPANTNPADYRALPFPANAGASGTRSAAPRIALVVVVVAAIAVVLGVALPAFSRRSSGVPSLDLSRSTSAADFSTQVPTVTPTEPIPTPLPFTKVLFQDDFGSSSSGWPRARNPNYTLEYKNGQYHVLINEQGQGQEVTRSNEQNYPDVSIEVDVQQTAGPTDGLMGVTCRNDNNGNFYSFEISQDGTYGIYKYSKDNGDVLDEETLDPNTIDQNNPSHLEAVCQGDTLTLLLSGRVLTQVQDSEYTKGAAGMLVRTGSSGAPGEDVLFSRFVVKGP